MVNLVEIIKEDGRYRLREFYVNPSWIVSISETSPTQEMISESQSIGLAPQARYSKIVISAGYAPAKEVTVVGDPASLNIKIGTKRILKG